MYGVTNGDIAAIPTLATRIAEPPETVHETDVIVDGRARYPYRPVCSCGWESRGYVSFMAAHTMADAHALGQD